MTSVLPSTRLGVVTLTVLCFELLVLAPLLTWCWYAIFTKSQDLQVFHTRRPFTVDVTVAVSCLFMFAICPLLHVSGTAARDLNWLSTIGGTPETAVFLSVQSAVMCSYLWRLWLIYFDFNYNRATICMEWSTFAGVKLPSRKELLSEAKMSSVSPRIVGKQMSASSKSLTPGSAQRGITPTPALSLSPNPGTGDSLVKRYRGTDLATISPNTCHSPRKKPKAKSNDDSKEKEKEKEIELSAKRKEPYKLQYTKTLSYSISPGAGALYPSDNEAKDSSKSKEELSKEKRVSTLSPLRSSPLRSSPRERPSLGFGVGHYSSSRSAGGNGHAVAGVSPLMADETSPEAIRQFAKWNWFLENKSTLGQRNYFGVVCVVLWFFFLCLPLVAVSLFLGHRMDVLMTQTVIWVLTLLCWLALTCKMPGLDLFKIRSELQHVLTSASIAVTLMLALKFSMPFTKRWLRFFTIQLAFFVCYTTSVLFTVYPHKVALEIERARVSRSQSPFLTTPQMAPKSAAPSKMPPTMYLRPSAHTLSVEEREKSKTKSKEDEDLGPPLCKKRSISIRNIGQMFQSVRGEESTGHSLAKAVTLDVIMGDEAGLQAFLAHLAQELSVENLFFLSDVCQFKDALVKERFVPAISGWYMRFPRSVPPSAILRARNPYLRAKLLCEKYVRDGSEREINLSYLTRKGILDKFDKEDFLRMPTAEEYMCRFDDAAANIRRLLKDSFSRFSATPEYKHFVKDYSKRMRRMSRSLRRMSKREDSHSRGRGGGIRSHATQGSRQISFQQSRQSSLFSPRIQHRTTVSSVLPKRLTVSLHSQELERSGSSRGRMVCDSPLAVGTPLSRGTPVIQSTLTGLSSANMTPFDDVDFDKLPSTQPAMYGKASATISSLGGVCGMAPGLIHVRQSEAPKRTRPRRTHSSILEILSDGIDSSAKESSAKDSGKETDGNTTDRELTTITVSCSGSPSHTPRSSERRPVRFVEESKSKSRSKPSLKDRTGSKVRKVHFGGGSDQRPSTGESETGTSTESRQLSGGEQVAGKPLTPLTPLTEMGVGSGKVPITPLDTAMKASDFATFAATKVGLLPMDGTHTHSGKQQMCSLELRHSQTQSHGDLDAATRKKLTSTAVPSGLTSLTPPVSPLPPPKTTTLASLMGSKAIPSRWSKSTSRSDAVKTVSRQLHFAQSSSVATASASSSGPVFGGQSSDDMTAADDTTEDEIETQL